MGSKRKKAQKAKDFVKPKLKVGKLKPKPTNYTDTSFSTRSIRLPSQSALVEKSFEVELVRNISLTHHFSAQKRKDSLVFIQNNFPRLVKFSINQKYIQQIIASVSKLIIDNDSLVRKEAFCLFEVISAVYLQLNCNTIVLYILTAMTHIDLQIRNDSTKILNLLISKQKNCLDSIAKNNWLKLLKSFFILLNWPL
ncbi:Ipi1p ASCRUDRAFT_18061, partial [Ascoidea rubescens DSM 1968]